MGLIPAASAQTPGEVDLSFDSGSFVDSSIFSVVPWEDEKVYVGGNFHTVRGAVRNGIARLNGNGNVDETFDPGNGVSGYGLNIGIKSVALQADGKVLIAGRFNSFDGTARDHIARLNADGSLDTTFDPGSGVSGYGADSLVSSVALQADGKVLIGGFFTAYNGVARNCIARLNPDGSLDTGFNPGSGASSYVNSVALQADGKILIGGNFINYNGVARNRIARLNVDGSLDSSFNPGNGSGSSVSSVALQADGKVLICGSFTSYDGMGRNRIARLYPDGSLDTGFDPGNGANVFVNSMALQADGKLLICGDFTSYDGVACNRIARLYPDGDLDTGFDIGSGASSSVNSVALHTNGKVVFGGQFITVNGVAINRIARLNMNGSLDTGFDPGRGGGGEGLNSVTSVVTQADGKVLIGSGFADYESGTRRPIVRLNADGRIDTAFDSGIGANGRVFSVAVHADGKVLIGGQFSSYNEVARNRIARLNADGTLDSTFDPGGGSSGEVRSVILQPDGKALIGGTFSSYNGAARKGIARLNVDGSLDMGFDPGSGADASVNSVALQRDGKVLIGGAFTTYNGVVRRGIARINTDGSLDASFDPGGGAGHLTQHDPVNCVVLQADGKIVVGGDFTSFDGEARSHIARLNVDGSLDSDFDVGSGAAGGAAGGVNSVAIQVDGKILIAGLFFSFDGVSRRHIARLNTDGSLDTTFDPESGPESGFSHGEVVNALALQSDGKVLIGGLFTSFDRMACYNLVRVINDSATQDLFASGKTIVFWARRGSVPEVERTIFHLSTDQGATWTELGSGVRTPGGWRLAGLNLPTERLIRARGFTANGGVVEFAGSGSPLPTVTSIGSGSVPGLDEQQWITIRGTGFASGAEVHLFDSVTSFLIPPERTVWRSDTEIRILANLTSVPAQWTAQVVNPGGLASIPLAFQVNPPVVRPLDDMDFGTVAPGDESERTFIVRNGGSSPAALSASHTSLFGPFEFAGGPYGDLAPGAEQQVVLRFAPIAPGSYSASVTFRLGNESVVRTLTGRAAPSFTGGSARVSGTVARQVGGESLANASIHLLRLDGERRVSTGYSARTGTEGEFTMEHIGAGDYVLVAQPPASARFFLEKVSLEIGVSDGSASNHNLLLPPAPGRNPTNPQKIPVVLVRGRGEAGGLGEISYWAALWNRLRPDFQHVWDPNAEFTRINGENGIQSNADELLDFILEKSASYEQLYGGPPPRIHLVAHSMGGLIVRQMLQNDSVRGELPSIGDVFMLSTPNAGTVLADIGGGVGSTPLLRNLISNWWRHDWQTNWDLRTSHVRDIFARQVRWPSASGIRLFIAGGTGIGNPLLYGDLALGNALIASASPGDTANDGAVTLLSSRGEYYPFSTLSLRSSFPDAKPYIPAQSVFLNHTEIKEHDVMLDWIEGILRDGRPGPVSMAGNEAPSVAQGKVATLNDAPQTAFGSSTETVTVDERSFVFAAGGSIVHEVPVETVPRADFLILHSDSTATVSLIEPGGVVIDAASAAGNPTIVYQSLESGEGGMVSISISDPEPGLWQVVVDGDDTLVEQAASIRVSCLSDLRLLPGHPERVGTDAAVSLSARAVFSDGAEAVAVTGGAVSVSMTDPVGEVTSVSLIDDGTHGDDAANDGTHGLVVSEPGGAGEYQLSFVVDGTHPVTGEPFRRFARGGFTRAFPGGFVAEILSHTAVDSDDNGYPDTVMLEASVEVAAAGDFTLSGRLLSEGHQESITAVADFSTEEAGSSAVTLLFTPHELPEGEDIGPFALDELLLFQRGENASLIDVFGGGYEVPVILHNELSRRIRLSGDLDFGAVPIGESSQRTLTIHNDSWATLSVGGLALPPGFSAAYQGRVDPGDAVEVDVIFTPVEEKVYQGEVVADSDAFAGGDRLALAGEGVAPEILVTGNGVEIQSGAAAPNPANHTDFGAAFTLNGTVERTFTIRNTGTASLSVGEVSVSGADFAIATQPSATVAPGTSTNFRIVFDPSAVGLRSGAVEFAINVSGQNPFSFAIQGTGTKIAQIINFSNPGAQLVTATVNLSATGGDSGNPVSFAVTSGPGSISGGNVLSFTGAGPVTITASQAGNNEYQDATPVARTFGVQLVPQTIVFPNPGSRFISEVLNLAATGGGSGNAVTFQVLNGPAVFTNGNALSFSGGGNVTVRASQAGNELHAEAVVNHTFAVLLPRPDVAVGRSPSSLVGSEVYAPSVQLASLVSSKLRPVTGFLALGNRVVLPDDRAADAVVLRGGRGNAFFKVAYLAPTGNVTAAVLAGTYQTPLVDADDAAVPLRSVVTPNKKKLTKKKGRTKVILRKTLVLPFSASSSLDPAIRDAASIKVETK